MITRFEKTSLALLLGLAAVFYGATIRSFAYSAIIDGEWVEMQNGTVVAADYQVAEADAGADWIEIVEKPETAEVVEAAPSLQTEDTINTNPYEELAARTTDEEWELLRWIIALESGGESFRGQQAVCETIFNRVLSPKWTAPWGGNTIGEVLRGKHQFSTLKWVGSPKAWCTPSQITDDVIAETIRSGPATVLPSEKYVYFDSKGGVNGYGHTKIGRQTFGAER